MHGDPVADSSWLVSAIAVAFGSGSLNAFDGSRFIIGGVDY